MALRDSIWLPESGQEATVIGSIAVMTLLHFTELLGLMDAGLLFGWLPVQFAYDIGYSFVAVGLLYWIYLIAPKAPERFQKGDSAEQSTPNSNHQAPEEV